jgi:hypothetical protein
MNPLKNGVLQRKLKLEVGRGSLLKKLTGFLSSLVEGNSD